MGQLISIIVPIYNVESYITDCIKSVLNQSFSHFELILVDDGSTDSSGKICDQFAARDPRITVWHMKNNGVSHARNIGMSISSSEWLIFLDGDDSMEASTLQTINHNIRQFKDIEMIIGSFRYVYNTGTVEEKNLETYKKGIEVIKDYGLWKLKICMGSFAVKREVVTRNGLEFNENTKYGEDVEFINYCLMNSEKVRVIENSLMNYFIHDQSSIARVKFDRYDCYKARKRTLSYIKKNYPGYRDIELLYEYYLLPQAIINTTNLLCREGISIIEIKKNLESEGYYNILQSVKNNENTPFELRMEITDFLKSPLLYWSQCSLLSKYYALRQSIGLIKRRLIG